MNKLLALITVCVIATLTSQASALGSVNAVRVTELSLDGTNLAWAHFSANIGGSRPACMNSGWANDLAFDPTTSKGKALLSVLTAALLSGKQVDVAGVGTCTTMATNVGAETLGYVKLRQ
jgi:hypothetical protein